MSHNVENMAYTGQRPWHGLGFELTRGAPLELWCQEAGLEWDAVKSPLYRPDAAGALVRVPGRYSLYREDTGVDLGIVAGSYNIVQPREVIEFYRALVDGMGFEMETAGCLSGGAKVWGLARTGEEFTLPGDDRVGGYILLATSYDGTMATSATRTSVRVVCNNTLNLALGKNGEKAQIRVPHNSVFNGADVRASMGLGDANRLWDDFSYAAKTMAKRKIKFEEAVAFFTKVLYPPNADGEIEVDIAHHAVAKRLGELEEIRLNAPGQQTESANDTVWGLLNAVTFWTDHSRKTQTNSSRLDRAWFGDGAVVKRRAFNEAMEMAA